MQLHQNLFTVLNRPGRGRGELRAVPLIILIFLLYIIIVYINIFINTGQGHLYLLYHIFILYIIII
jgi:hypothetical protein